MWTTSTLVGGSTVAAVAVVAVVVQRELSLGGGPADVGYAGSRAAVDATTSACSS
jgi:hypothetical protein